LYDIRVRFGISESRAGAESRSEERVGWINPRPTLVFCGILGCAEAPEIVPEGPGYR